MEEIKGSIWSEIRSFCLLGIAGIIIGVWWLLFIYLTAWAWTRGTKL